MCGEGEALNRAIRESTNWSSEIAVKDVGENVTLGLMFGWTATRSHCSTTSV